MTDSWQKLLFESLEWLSPELAAIAAGFAVLVGGVMFVTPAGERYLERLST
jgi:hypothetical protein